MRLMDEPYTRRERENTLRMLDGVICRLCVTDDPKELVRMLGFGCSYLSMLAQSRILELGQKSKKEV